MRHRTQQNLRSSDLTARREPTAQSRPPRWRRVLEALLYCSLLGSQGGCGGKVTAPAPAPPNVRVITVATQDVPVYGDWVATLYGDVDAKIQPEVSGYLIKQNYHEGSLVHRGEVLFEIDPRPFQAAVDQAEGQLAQGEAQLSLAELNVHRDTPLAQAHAIAQSQLDNDVQSRAQYRALIKTSQAQVETAKLNLGFTKVRTLIDGIAGIATTQIGNLVTQATTLTTVSKVDPIKVYFSLSDPEYLELAGRIGADTARLLDHDKVPLTLTLSNGSVYPRPGYVDFVDREVDPQTGTIRLVGLFPNPDHLLREGQFAHVRAQTGMHRGAIIIPQGAVNELQGRHQVAVVGADNKAAIRTVTPGDRVGQMWIIDTGLKAGERVVVDGFSKVKDGQTVNPSVAAPALVSRPSDGKASTGP